MGDAVGLAVAAPRGGRIAGLAVLLAILGAVALFGCTLEDRYNTARSDQLAACNRLVTERQREECRARLPPASYEEYERLRRAIPPKKAGGGS